MSGEQSGAEEHNEDDSSGVCRVVLTDAELVSLSSQEVATRWRQQDSYITCLERRLARQEGEVAGLREAAERVRGLHQESQQREKVLVRRLAAKEQEMQDYVCQVSEMKASQAAPPASGLRSALLDPAVNGLLQLLRAELQATRARLEDTQNELSAWKFTPDSNTGKRLMAKCRLLYQENEELGRVTSSGRIATLEGELALQKSFSEEVRQSQQELDGFLGDIDEDVEGMQSTIVFLQQELRKTKELLTSVQKENATLKGGGGGGGNNNTTTATSPALLIKANGESVNANVVVSNNVTINSSGDNVVNVNVKEEDNIIRTRSCSLLVAGSNNVTSSSNKRIRRSSVLSIDYNDDDDCCDEDDVDDVVDDDDDDDVDEDADMDEVVCAGDNATTNTTVNKNATCITNGDVQMSDVE